MLPLTRTTFSFNAASPLTLPQHPGSAWRGAFGAALRELVCITGRDACAGCPLLHRCAYPEIFETPAPQGASMLAPYRDAPHPYVLRTSDSRQIERGSMLRVDLTLMGRAVRHAALVTQAMRTAGTRMTRQSCLELLNTAEAHPAGNELAQDDRPPAALRIVLETPLRLRVRDAYLGAEQFSFGSFFTTLIRRVSQLSEVHADGLPHMDYRDLAVRARTQGLRAVQLRWQDAHRYSSRQKRDVPMGGLLGDFEIEGDLSAFWPWLRIGQFVHVGKGAVMGLGAYRLEPIP